MSTNTTTRSQGPDLLNQRSLGGIGVHFLALLTGILGAGVVYAVSNHPYTRENARNAFNWHLSVLVVFTVGFVTFFLGADETTVGGEAVDLTLVPAPIDTAFALVGFVLLFVAMVAALLTLIFAVVATVKAIFGTPWRYPFAWEFVE